MKLYHKIFFILLTLLSPYAFSQTQEDFEAFGKQVFDELIDTNHLYYVQFIRNPQYNDIINKQDLSAREKELMNHEINKNFPQLYSKFQESIDYLWDEYTREKRLGANYTYLKTEWEAPDNTRYIYTLKVTFLFSSKKVETRVSLTFDVGWTDGYFSLISGIEEDF